MSEFGMQMSPNVSHFLLSVLLGRKDVLECGGLVLCIPWCFIPVRLWVGEIQLCGSDVDVSSPDHWLFGIQ